MNTILATGTGIISFELALGIALVLIVGFWLLRKAFKLAIRLLIVIPLLSGLGIGTFVPKDEGNEQAEEAQTEMPADSPAEAPSQRVFNPDGNHTPLESVDDLFRRAVEDEK